MALQNKRISLTDKTFRARTSYSPARSVLTVSKNGWTLSCPSGAMSVFISSAIKRSRSATTSSSNAKVITLARKRRLTFTPVAAGTSPRFRRTTIPSPHHNSGTAAYFSKNYTCFHVHSTAASGKANAGIRDSSCYVWSGGIITAQLMV